MASFLCASTDGGHFDSPDFWAWYASSTIRTAVAEVLSGLAREVELSALSGKQQTYREYTANLREGMSTRGG